MRALLTALYSACVYVFFLATFLYAIGFVEGVVVPKTIDSGVPGALVAALSIDTLLLGVFAIQHSVMARPAFKRVWTRVVPEDGRTQHLRALRQRRPGAAALAMAAGAPTRSGRSAIRCGPARCASSPGLGWALLLASTFLISHFHLFGLGQGFARILKLEGAGWGIRDAAVLPLDPPPAVSRLHPRLLGHAEDDASAISTSRPRPPATSLSASGSRSVTSSPQFGERYLRYQARPPACCCRSSGLAPVARETRRTPV